MVDVCAVAAADRNQMPLKVQSTVGRRRVTVRRRSK